MVAPTDVRIGIKLKIHFVTISDTIDTDPKEKVLSASIRLDIAMLTKEFHNSPRHSPYTCSKSIATAGLSTGTRAIACQMTRLIAAVAFANAGHITGTSVNNYTRLNPLHEGVSMIRFAYPRKRGICLIEEDVLDLQDLHLVDLHLSVVRSLRSVLLYETSSLASHPFTSIMLISKGNPSIMEGTLCVVRMALVAH